MSEPGPRKAPALKKKPKAFTRRSDTERAAAEAAEKERLKAREQAALDEAKAEANQRRIQYGFSDQGRGRGRGRGNDQRGRGGRGGFMGDRGALQGQLSGLGTGAGQLEGVGRRMWEERARTDGDKRTRPRSRNDADFDGSSGGRRDRVPGAAQASSSSKSASSSLFVEETAPAPSKADRKDRKVKKQESEDEDAGFDDTIEIIDLDELNLMPDSNGSLLPIAAGRQEHVERQFYINTDSSAAVAGHKSRAGKGDPELNDIVKVEHDDDETLPDADPQVKEEPPSSPEISKGSKRAPRTARPKPSAPPQHLTDEQRIQETNRQVLLDELGPLPPQLPPETEGAPGNAQFNPRQDTLFLFQLPPRLPPLTQRGVKVKQEPKDEPSDLSTAAEKTEDDEMEIKEEDGGLPPSDSTKTNTNPDLHPGFVGKMQVWKSGKVTLDWGGVRMVVRKGLDSNFAETVVGLDMQAKTEGGLSGEYAGTAYSFGQVRGKMVVTPDYGSILGLDREQRKNRGRRRKKGGDATAGQAEVAA